MNSLRDGFSLLHFLALCLTDIFMGFLRKEIIVAALKTSLTVRVV